jgi:hypothetical protein
MHLKYLFSGLECQNQFKNLVTLTLLSFTVHLNSWCLLYLRSFNHKLWILMGSKVHICMTRPPLRALIRRTHANVAQNIGFEALTEVVMKSTIF